MTQLEVKKPHGSNLAGGTVGRNSAIDSVPHSQYHETSGKAITLTAYEMSMAANVGLQRQIAALTDRRPDRHGCKPEDGWNMHVEGACGEMAVAKALGVYWSGSVDTFKVGGDVGSLQVRTTRYPDGKLIVRNSDRDTDVFLLVTGENGHYFVRGWLFGSECKRKEWHDNPGSREPAFFVPQTALNPLDTLHSASATGRGR